MAVSTVKKAFSGKPERKDDREGGIGWRLA